MTRAITSGELKAIVPVNIHEDIDFETAVTNATKSQILSADMPPASINKLVTLLIQIIQEQMRLYEEEFSNLLVTKTIKTVLRNLVTEEICVFENVENVVENYYTFSGVTIQYPHRVVLQEEEDGVQPPNLLKLHISPIN